MLTFDPKVLDSKDLLLFAFAKGTEASICLARESPDGDSEAETDHSYSHFT